MWWNESWQNNKYWHIRHKDLFHILTSIVMRMTIIHSNLKLCFSLRWLLIRSVSWVQCSSFSFTTWKCRKRLKHWSLTTKWQNESAVPPSQELYLHWLCGWCWGTGRSCHRVSPGFLCPSRSLVWGADPTSGLYSVCQRRTQKQRSVIPQLRHSNNNKNPDISTFLSLITRH